MKGICTYRQVEVGGVERAAYEMEEMRYGI